MATEHHDTIPLRKLQPYESIRQTDGLNDTWRGSFGEPEDTRPAVPHARSPEINATSRKFRFLEDIWFIELISCVVALASLMAIILTLVIHQGKPLPQWPKMISINSLIAIFTALLKAAIVMPVAEGISQLKWLWYQRPQTLIELEEFDSASRGPWGSFLLLLKLRKHYLASFGALITVLALAIDPFSQQIIQYYSCSQMVPDYVVHIPKTQNFSQGTLHAGAGQSSLEGYLLGALSLGVAAPMLNGSFDIPYQCPTGNCTFPSDDGASFSTLGICSTCRDISDSVRFNSTYDYFWLSNGTDSDLVPDIIVNRGHVLQTRLSLSDNIIFDGLISFQTLMTRRMSTPGINCTMFSNIKCTWEAFATDCVLYPCIQTYFEEIVNSVLRENIVTRQAVRRSCRDGPSCNPVGDFQQFSMVTNSTLRDGVWRPCNATGERTKENSVAISVNGTVAYQTMFKNGSYTGLYPPGTMFYSPECVWFFGYGPSNGLRSRLNDLYSNQTLLSLTADGPATEGSLQALGLYNNGTATLASVSNILDNIARALTMTMRINGAATENNYAKGSMYSTHTCIRVRWAWIVLPGSLVALSISFLGATILYCKSRNLWYGAWKSSSLALLFFGIDRPSQDVGRAQTKGEMEETAKSVRVQLTEMDGKLRFVER